MGSSGSAGTAHGAEGDFSMMTVQEWLTSVRKLDAELLSHMGVCEKQHPNLGAVAAFPYSKAGKPYAAKFRAVHAKDWRSTQGVSRGLYNEDCLRADESLPIVITEGEIDALSCMQAGHTRAVSLPDGWTADGGKRDVLVAAEDLLRRSPFVIVAGDNDEAGASLPRTVANILAGHDVRRVTWPEGCKDANDVLVRFGEGELARCLVAAVRIDPEGGFITGISDLPPLPARRVLRVGCIPFDWCLAFEVGAMSVLTGMPGMGKTTFALFALYHLARHERIRVGIMAFETHPYRIRDQLCRIHTGRPWDALPPREQAETAAFLDRHFRIVHRTFEDRAHSLGWLKDMVYALAVRDNCKLVAVDPWNELEHLPQPGESMTSYINWALQQIRQMAEQWETHILLAAHPRKMPTDGTHRSPTGYDIADSAGFYNKPALGFTVHQDLDEAGDNFVMITAWKVRETQLYGFDRGASIRLTFSKEDMTYHRYATAAGGQS